MSQSALNFHPANRRSLPADSGSRKKDLKLGFAVALGGSAVGWAIILKIALLLV